LEKKYWREANMLTIAIILLSVVVLILILYLTDFKLEFNYSKTIKDKNIESKKTELESLSNTEFSVLKLVSEGKTNQEIADQLFISVHTVKKHISNIFKKLNLSSRSETRKYKDHIAI
jgi:DNA-binding NarL/FixJ family response regulator